MSVTIKDIAERAGVSFSTVSKALRNSPLVQETTRRKVIEVAQRMGYQPNYTARRLVSKKSGVIGVVWPTVERSTLSRLITNINDKLERSSYTTLLSINPAESAIEAFYRLQVDAILLFADREVDMSKRLPRGSNLPILQYGIAEHAAYPTIDVQRGKAIGLALGHLIELGHKRIAYIGAPEYRDTLQDQKVHAYRNHMNSAGLLPVITPIDGMESHDGYFAAKSIFTESQNDDRITAIISGSYDLTRGIVRAAEEQDVAIPDDYSIVSYDNFQQSDGLGIPVTVVGANVDAIADSIASTLLLMAEGETITESIKLEPELVIRSSTAAIVN